MLCLLHYLKSGWAVRCPCQLPAFCCTHHLPCSPFPLCVPPPTCSLKPMQNLPPSCSLKPVLYPYLPPLSGLCCAHRPLPPQTHAMPTPPCSPKPVLSHSRIPPFLPKTKFFLHYTHSILFFTHFLSKWYHVDFYKTILRKTLSYKSLIAIASA